MHKVSKLTSAICLPGICKHSSFYEKLVEGKIMITKWGIKCSSKALIHGLTANWKGTNIWLSKSDSKMW